MKEIKKLAVMHPFRSEFCERGGCYIFPEMIFGADGEDLSVEDQKYCLRLVLDHVPFIGFDTCILDASENVKSELGHYPFLRIRTVDYMRTIANYNTTHNVPADGMPNLDDMINFKTSCAFKSGAELTARTYQVDELDDCGGGRCCMASECGCQLLSMKEYPFDLRELTSAPVYHSFLSQIKPDRILDYIYTVDDNDSDEMFQPDMEGCYGGIGNIDPMYREIFDSADITRIDKECAKAWIPYHKALDEVIQYYRELDS